MNIFYIIITVAIAYVFRVDNPLAVLGIFLALLFVHWFLFVRKAQAAKKAARIWSDK